jgi:MFS family permease
MAKLDARGPSRWYQSLNWTQWKALIASNLGWTFDGFEVFALILTVGAALHQLLDASQYPLIPFYTGVIIAITVFGWGAGGLLGGILADYIGRKRSMTLTILAYSALTGLSALSWNWLSFALFRFLVGLAIGSEWATGASITAELWPDHARGKGGAFLQSGYPIGSILASGVWVAIGALGPGAWRYMYLIGVLPALVAFWIRRNIPESPRWERSSQQRRAAHDLKRRGAVLKGEDAAIVRFTLVDMFAEPAVRSRLWLTFIMSLSGDDRLLGRFQFCPELCRNGRHRCGTRGATLGRIGRPRPKYRRPCRLHQLRLSGRCVWPQADDISLLSDELGPHPNCLFVGAGGSSVAARIRNLWIFRSGHLFVDRGMAS